MDTELTVNIGISSLALQGKLPKNDARWAELGASFVNTAFTIEPTNGLYMPMDLINAIWTGHAYTVKLKKKWRETLNFDQGWHLCLDLDTGDKRSSIAVLRKDPFLERFASFIYETYSADSAAGIYKSRVVFLLDQPIYQPENYVLAATSLLWMFSLADPLCKDAVRQWFGTYHKDVHILGNVLPLDMVKHFIQSYQASGRAARRTFQPRPFNGKNDDEALNRIVNAMRGAVSGNRNATLNEQAFILGLNIADGRIDETWGKGQLLQAALSTGLDTDEAEYTIKRAVEHGKDSAMLNQRPH